MTSLQSINIAFIPHSTTLLPNAVLDLPDTDGGASHSTTDLLPDAALWLPSVALPRSTSATLLPDADESPDAAPELPDAIAFHSTATIPLHDTNFLLLAELATHLQKMSSYHIVEEHRIKFPQYVVKILTKEADFEFIEGVYITAAKYVALLSKPFATSDEWCSVGQEWRNCKKRIDKITSTDSTVNHTRPLWKLPSAIHAYILSYLPNEDVLRVSYMAKGSLSTMVHQDEDLWQQRTIYQLGGDQAIKLHAKYSWKTICLILTYKGIKPFEDGELKKGEFVNGILIRGTITYPYRYKEKGTFKYEKLCGQGRKQYYGGLIRIEKGLFEDGKLNGPGKRTWKSKQVDEGLFRNGRFIVGKRTYSQGDIEEGTFEFDNLYQGKRKKNFINGVVIEEEGIFHVQGLHGKGKRILTKKIEASKFVHGEFKPEKRTDLDKDTEEGTFHLGELTQGTKTFASGVVREEEGSFEKGRLHGKGTRILKTGKIKKGIFEHGKLVHSAFSNSTTSRSSFSSFFRGCLPR